MVTMQLRMTTLERAFELARSGEYLDVGHLKRRLTKEGYVGDQLSGPTLLAQIRALIRASREEERRP